MLIDLANQCVNANALAPANLTQSTQGAAQDFRNGQVDLQAVIDVGSFGANTTSLTVQIEESSTTNSGFTTIPAVGGGNMAQTVTTNGQYILKGLRSKRYVRANAVTVTGTTPSVNVSVNLHSEAKFAGSGGGYSRSPST